MTARRRYQNCKEDLRDFRKTLDLGFRTSCDKAKQSLNLRNVNSSMNGKITAWI